MASYYGSGNTPHRRLGLFAAAAAGAVLGLLLLVTRTGLWPPGRGDAASRSVDREEATLLERMRQAPSDPAAAVAHVRLLLSEKRLSDAREAGAVAAASFPEDPAVLDAHADALAAAGQLQEAIAVLGKLSAPSSAQRLQMAQWLIRAGRRTEAVGLLKSIATPDPAEALFAGQLFLDAREPSAAVIRLRPISGGGGDARNYLGFAQLLSGDYAQAAEILLPAAHHGAEVATLQQYVGSALRLAGDLQRLPQAEAHLRRATELAPREAAFHYELALARVQLRDLRGARAAMEQAAALAPDVPEVQRDLARIYAHSKEPLAAAQARARHLRILDDPAGAIRELEPLANRSPSEVPLLLALSAACHEAGEYARATELVERLQRREPRNTEVLWSQFRLRSALKQYDQALLTLANLEKEQEDSVPVLDERAVTLERLARHSEAEPILQELCAREPSNASFQYRLGVSLSLWSQRPDAQQAAEASFRKALELRPAYPEAHQALGKLLVARGLTAEAIPHFRRALDLAPGYQDALRALGRAYQKLGEQARSQDAFARFRVVEAQQKERERLELPVRQLRDLRRSRAALSKFYLQSGDEKAAIRQLEALAHAYPDDREAHAALEGLYGHARRFQRQFEEREWLKSASRSRSGGAK